MEKDEAFRQQQDDIDWDGLEREIEINTKSKVDALVSTLPRHLKVSRSRETDREVFGKRPSGR